MRISKLKFMILVCMSVFGLWASGMVVVIFYLLKEALPFCGKGTGPGIVFNCSTVLSSPYSEVFGVPLELLAVFYFVVNISLVYLIAFGTERIFEVSLDILFVWRFIGITIVPYLLFVELFILKAICIYCTIMHTAIVVDFVIISYLLFFRQSKFFGPGAEPDELPVQPKVQST